MLALSQEQRLTETVYTSWLAIPFPVVLVRMSGEVATPSLRNGGSVTLESKLKGILEKNKISQMDGEHLDFFSISWRDP